MRLYEDLISPIHWKSLQIQYELWITKMWLEPNTLFNEPFMHSQKQLVQWAVYLTVEFYACMLSGWCCGSRMKNRDQSGVSSADSTVNIYHTAMKKFTNLFEMKIKCGMSYLFWECVQNMDPPRWVSSRARLLIKKVCFCGTKIQ